ncbi:MAG: CpsB/CapC family capsule biosynthesis tyrosine phosphatase [Acidobacteriota bacterium]
MIDLHSHPLPGIDDGVQDADEAVAMCRIAVEEGIRTLVATPHMREDLFPNRRGDILERIEKLRERLAREEVDLEISAGAEVYLEPDLVERLRAGEYLTINDAGYYVLLELPTRHLPAGTEDLIYRLRLEGITPVIAHPERLGPIQDDPDCLGRLVELGALAQLTAGSLLGQFGSAAQRSAQQLLTGGLAHVLASDAHNSGARAPRLRRALAEATALVGREAAERMVQQVPRAILDGEEIEVGVETAERSTRGSGWLDWLRGRGK